MTRSILFSLLAIGVAATVVAFAGTQALFTDTQTASGDVNAGTIDLYLLESDASDDNAADEFVFELPVSENLLPGEFATDGLRFRNDGTAPLTITSLDFSTSIGADCDPGNPGDEFVPSITGIAVGDVIPVAGIDDATLRVDLVAAAGNPCQGDTFNLVLIVGVSS
jgi:predicted ribosomally synthesized peptide with SipW-like signal peptide